MRSATAILYLLTVPTALAAPVPWMSHPTSIAHHLFGSRALSAEDAAAAVADLEVYLNDHRPFTPAADMPPSVVLALRRPIATTWLMSLSTAKPGQAHDPASTAAARTLGTGTNVPIRLASTNDKVEAVLLSSDIEAAVRAANARVTADKVADSRPDANEKLAEGAAEPSEVFRPTEQVNRNPSRVDVPCLYAQLRRDYNDMMVISLVAIFLLVVVAVEFWYSTERETDVEDVPVGAIKLEDHQPPSKE